MTLVNWAVGHASLSWTLSSAKTKCDLFLNEITLSGWADVACRNTVHELPVGLTSLYIRNIYGSQNPHERNPGKMTFTTPSGLLPAGIAVYVQRGPNGVGLETRYSVGL